MPVLKNSTSDYTAFVRANATLPVVGKPTKTTNAPAATIVTAAKSVAIASTSAAKAAPSTTIVTVASKVTTSNKTSIK